MQELKELRSLLRGYYYQSVWDDFDTHEAIWDFFYSDLKDKKRALHLITELSEAPSINPKELMDSFYQSCDGLSFETYEELLAFLEAMKNYFLKKTRT